MARKKSGPSIRICSLAGSTLMRNSDGCGTRQVDAMASSRLAGDPSVIIEPVRNVGVLLDFDQGELDPYRMRRACRDIDEIVPFRGSLIGHNTCWRMPRDDDWFCKPRAVREAIEGMLEELAIPEQLEDRFGPLGPAKRSQPRGRTESTRAPPQ